MAKRRKLEAPSAEDLNRIEDEFRRETSPRKGAPIAQVAGEAAGAYEPGNPEERANRARDAEDAEHYRAASDKGLITLQVPVEQIDRESMPRDRTVMTSAGLEELEKSITLHGLRLPIEIYRLPEPRDGYIYGLLSGFRRHMAMERLHNAYRNAPEFATINAILRDPAKLGGAFRAMVEENEVRENLSHYERGRIAVIAAQEGAYHNTEEAVNELFAVASRAKRSKIRTFAMIHEELGDLLQFPEEIREKDGLRLAAGLRAAGSERLREVLGSAPDGPSEWEVIETVLKEIGPTETDRKRGGRPKARVREPGWVDHYTLRTATGVTMRREADSNGYLIRFSGKGLDGEMIEVIMMEVQRMLERK